MSDAGVPSNVKQQTPVASAGPNYPANVSSELSVLVDPQSRFAREMFACATKLKQMHIDNGVRSLCFTADANETGTTVVAANVAAAFATMGLRTLLIEANFMRPRLARMFDLPPERFGLSEWVSGLEEGHSWVLFMNPVYPYLVVVHAGHETATAAATAALAKELPYIVDELSRTFDIILFDAPSMAEPDAILPVLSAVEMVVAVARENVTKIKNLVQLDDLIAKSRAKFGGFIYVDR